MLASEERFRLAFYTSPDSINFNRLDDGTYIDINEGFTKIMGYTREDVIGKTILNLNVWKNAEDRKRLIDGLTKTGYIENLEAPFIGKDGKIRYGLMSARIARIGNENVIISITRDITNRKRYEEALRESEEKYRNILTNIEDGYYEVDIAGNFTFFNESMCRILGYSTDELMGMNNRGYMDGENAKKIFQVFHDVYQTGEATRALDWKLIRKDGSECYVETVVSLVTDSNNDKVGFRGIARDVSDRKAIEAQLRHARKMEAIGTLAGGIAHEFNNVLGIIIGNTELAMDDTPEWNPVRQNLDEINLASQRAKDVVKQLLNFSRKAETHKKPIDIKPIVKESLKLLRASIPTTIDIQINILENIYPVVADPTQVHQLLFNLCTNAAHAMDEEGGILTIHLENVDIAFGNASNHADLQEGSYAKLVIGDTGHGIDPKSLDKIFDPYFTTKEVGKGTGMGLAVVHGIVMSHGGTIVVDSKVKKGTTFSIFLPAASGDVAKEEDDQGSLPSGSEKILFVDDEKSLVKMGELILSRLGYHVVTETNPIKALGLFKSKPDIYDLIISDMTMPYMTGEKLAKELLKIRKNIPIIICTGFSEKLDKEKALSVGICEYVDKPINKTELSRIVRKVLDAAKR